MKRTKKIRVYCILEKMGTNIMLSNLSFSTKRKKHIAFQNENVTEES